MRRYSDNKLLIFLNMVLEYIIMLGTYIFCGYLRIMIPQSIGKRFSIKTFSRFLPFMIVLCLAIVIIYFLMGDYFSIHYRSKNWVVIESFAVSLVAGVFGSAILFFTEDKQFSRILLVMLVVGWTIAISVKRIFISAIARRVFSDKIITHNILIIGSGDMARKYYEGIESDTSSRYTFVGYIADGESDYIPNYLGGYDRIYEEISKVSLNKVVIAENGADRELLKEVLTVCSVFGKEAVIIPVFSDYIIENQPVKTEFGTHCLTVNAFNTSNILGVNVSVTDMDRTIRDIRNNLTKWRGKYICVSNVHTTVMAYDNPDYKKVQNGAVMALPDGGPLSSYSRSEGKSDARRVTGPDLMREILKRSGEYGWKHFFYGSTQKTLDMLKDKIDKDYPGAQVVGMISPPYRELSPEEDAQYVDMINEANPDFVWVGLGAPKQEIWMAAHQDRVMSLMLGVGAAFDYESGNLKRAPQWMQKCNLEWLYRFMQEPRRLFKRYFVTNIKFLWLTRR